MPDLQWFSNVDDLPQLPPHPIFDWLTKPYVLSKALKRVCQKLEVTVIDQCFQDAYQDEYVLLNMEHEPKPFVRQVFLNGDGIALTYGRVVIPSNTYQAHFSHFDTLGTNLLGETLLYNNPDVTRGAFEYVYINKTDPLSIQMHKELKSDYPQQSLWGRRSVFMMKSHPLLVMEILLPTLPDYIA